MILCALPLSRMDDRFCACKSRETGLALFDFLQFDCGVVGRSAEERRDGLDASVTAAAAAAHRLVQMEVLLRPPMLYMHGRPLCFTWFFLPFLFFFWTPASEVTERNSTVLYFSTCWEWTGFENGCAKFGRSLPLKGGVQNLLIFRWFYVDIATLRISSERNWKIKLRRVSYIPLKFNELWPTDSWDYVAHFYPPSGIFSWNAGRPSDHNCSLLKCLLFSFSIMCLYTQIHKKTNLFFI